jgi:predicted nucleic acid-binding protein
VSGLLDTSMIVRYLTGDSPELADRAARIIDLEEDLQITGGVLTETAYVLTSVYGVARATVVDHLMSFLQRENISVVELNKGLVLQALLLCRPSGRVSFADAMLWAVAQTTDDKVVYSLDERFPNEGIEVRRR